MVGDAGGIVCAHGRNWRGGEGGREDRREGAR